MRHALRHWLGIQAERAVETACRIDFKSVELEVQDEVEKVDASTKHVVEALNIRRELAITDAARALVKAERLHREIVRRGGRGR